jgi:hypothetical protein
MCSDHPKFGARLQTIFVRQMRRLQYLTFRIEAGSEFNDQNSPPRQNFGGE